LLPRGTVVWDLHEIPATFNRVGMRWLFHLIERRCRAIIHANPHRIEFLVGQGLIREQKKHMAIRNFPDRKFKPNAGARRRYAEVVEWCRETGFVYLQGLDKAGRYPYETIAALLRTVSQRILVVGDFDEPAKQRLEREFGVKLGERVRFVGMVKQADIASLLTDAMFSIVLYNTEQPNNRYCEANRFYQALFCGVPVICGCNEPMAEIVRKYRVGVVLPTDGSDRGDLEKGITFLLDEIGNFKSNIVKCRDAFIWSDEVVLNVLNETGTGTGAVLE